MSLETAVRFAEILAMDGSADREIENERELSLRCASCGIMPMFEGGVFCVGCKQRKAEEGE